MAPRKSLTGKMGVKDKTLKLIRRIAGTDRILSEVRSNYVQTEALLSLLQVIQLNAPLPRMSGWAILPDFANVLVNLLRERRPKLVLELGSGVSTLITGYVLKEWGGHMLSFEHQKEFVKTWQREVCRHQLAECVAVAWAPLKKVPLVGREFLWYDLPEIEGVIDLMLVDGPPGLLQPLSRYPALPCMAQKLASDATILLDDSFREDEKEILRRWQAEGGFDCELVQTEKGAAILRRGSPNPPPGA